MPFFDKNILLIRTDAHTSIGAGHVMRCLALAQQWKRSGGDVYFAMAMDAGGLFDRLNDEGIKVFRINDVPNSQDDHAKTITMAKDLNAKWVVLDGYHLSTDFQKALKNAGEKVIVVDDNGEHSHYFADVILNPNIYAKSTFYPPSKIESYTQLLIGSEYTLLREEFFNFRNFKRKPTSLKSRLLVLMGSGDPENVTLLVLEALRKLKKVNVHCRVVAGANNPHLETLRNVISTLKGETELLVNVDNMPELYKWADVAVTATGSTCYELNFMQVPFVSIVVAKNQLNLAKMISELNGVSLGWYHLLKVEKITSALLCLFNGCQEVVAPKINYGNFVKRNLMEVDDG